MKSNRFLVFTLAIQACLISIQYSGFSQEYSYRHYTVKDGLVQNQVINMFQDSKGYIWIGTKGGVSRFDGLSFVNYTVNDGLLSNYISHFFEDANGGLYFSSLIGTSRLKDGQITTVIRSDTIRNNYDYSVIPEFSENDMCVLSTFGFPIYTGPYDSLLVSSLSCFDGIGLNFITKEEAYNKYWIKDADSGLYVLSGNSLIQFSDNFTGRIIRDKKGGLYACDGSSMFIPDTLAGQFIKQYDLPKGGPSILFDFDYSGNPYFGLAQKSVVVYDGNRMNRYKKKFNYINKILVDFENNLWIGTETGFYKKISDAFENYTPESGANEYIWSIVEDAEQNIWFASYGDGLGMWDGSQFNRRTDVTNVYDTQGGAYFYTGAIRASNNDLYFPVRGSGVLKFDGTNFSLLPDLPAGSVLDVYEDSTNRRLLAASTEGVIILEDYQKPVLHSNRFKEAGRMIKTIAQDKHGNYWLGGEYILNVFDGKEFVEFPNEQFDYDHGAISIYKDHKKNMWLGPTSGLDFFNYDEYRKIGSKVLLSQVVSFVEHDSSRLMMGVSEGLAILDLDAFYKDSTESIQILDDANGFLGFDCLRNGILKDSRGSIWVTASDRLVKFHPDKLQADTVSPTINIHRVSVSSSPGTSEVIYNYYDRNDEPVELPYYNKNFRIDFHAVHFTAPEKVRYQVQLIGYDDEWSGFSSERTASYTNLTAGTYTLQVSGQNFDGVLSREPARFYFKIVPAFWQTVGFRIFANITIGLTLLLLGYWIMNFRRKRRMKIRETERQISELQLKTIRSQMDPHFTFNALNSISSVIYKEDKEKAYRYFTKFSRLIRSSLEVSDKITRSLQEEIDFTRNYLDLEKIRFKDNFKYRVDVDDNVDMDLSIPKMIIQSYAENAVKHGLKHLDRNRKLNISLKIEGNNLNIIIEDNGIGREHASRKDQFSTGKGTTIMDSIFDLYYKMYRIRISQETEDLYDQGGNPSGTRVVVNVPAQKG